MKVTTTAERLKEYMAKHNLRQVDILSKAEPICKECGVKMNKSDLSQYVSGKTEPGQDKLYVLSRALNVSEVWLMGYEDNIDDALFTLRYDIDRIDLNNSSDKEILQIFAEYLKYADQDALLQSLSDLGVKITAVRFGENIYKKLTKNQRKAVQDYLFKNPTNENEIDILQSYLKLNAEGETILLDFLYYLLSKEKFTK